MNFNKWTLALAAAGVVSLGSSAQAEEAQHAVGTALSSTTLSGYVDTSAIWKFGTGNNSMPGRSFDGANKQDGFNLNVVKLTLEKPLDEGQWAAGYKADLLMGPDAKQYRSLTAGAANGELAIQQAYVNLRAPLGNGLDFKMGVFDTIVGYETFDSYKNPNYSRSYAYGFEPLQHTGLLASYQVAEWIGVQAGIANTINSDINGRAFRLGGKGAVESEKTYMAGVTLTAPESMGFLKGATLYTAVINGLNGAGSATAADMTHYYVGATLPTPVTGLTVGAAYDYRWSGSTPTVAANYMTAASLYLSYQATEKLKFNNRAEYAAASYGTVFPTGFAIPARQNDEVLADTFTVDYSLWANVITRAEFRVDHYLDGGPGAFGGNGSNMTLDKNALSLALNVIYKF